MPTGLLYTIIQKFLKESRLIDQIYVLRSHKKRAKCVFVESGECVGLFMNN